MQTDPYGELIFAIGDADDFWCFDYDTEGDMIRLHAVINSETGGFIQNAEEPVELPKEEAADYALYLTDNALSWLFESGDPIEHDTQGWNQDPYYFYRCVKNAAAGGSPLIDDNYRIVEEDKQLEVPDAN